jgi:hypothetical protein
MRERKYWDKIIARNQRESVTKKFQVSSFISPTFYSFIIIIYLGLFQSAGLVLFFMNYFSPVFETMLEQTRNKKENILFSLLESFSTHLLYPLLIVAWPFVVIHSFQPFQVQRTNKNHLLVVSIYFFKFNRVFRGKIEWKIGTRTRSSHLLWSCTKTRMFSSRICYPVCRWGRARWPEERKSSIAGRWSTVRVCCWWTRCSGRKNTLESRICNLF